MASAKHGVASLMRRSNPEMLSSGTYRDLALGDDYRSVLSTNSNGRDACARDGLERILWPLAMANNLPQLTYRLGIAAKGVSTRSTSSKWRETYPSFWREDRKVSAR